VFGIYRLAAVAQLSGGRRRRRRGRVLRHRDVQREMRADARFLRGAGGDHAPPHRGQALRRVRGERRLAGRL